MATKIIELDPSIWNTTDTLDEDMSPLRENPEIDSFTDLQLQEAWYNFCRNIHLSSWVTPTGRNKHFIAFLVLFQCEGCKNDELDLTIIGKKVYELWPE